MGESAEMGSREGGRGRTKDVTMLRIDHSDVYIENERLGEDLVHTIDTIHRRRYQKVMSRDTEINELKQSLLTMRQVNHRSTSSASLKKSKSTASPRRSKVKNRNSTKKTTQFNGKMKNTERPKDGKMQGDRRSTSTPSTAKSIKVIIPRNDNDKNSSDDSSDDEGDSDSDFNSTDDDDDDDDSSDDSVDGGNVQTKKNQNSSSNGPSAKMSRNVTSASTVSNRHHSNNNSKNNNNRYGNNNNSHANNINLIKRSDPLSRIMSRLNLDKLPPSWYTQVVPASDIYVNKRIIGADGGYSGNSNSKHGVRFSKKSTSQKLGQTTAAVRPSTTAGDIFRQDSSILPMQRGKNPKNQIREQQRPFTTPGVRYTGGDGGGQWPRSRIDGGNKTSDFINEDRSQSVLFCEQAAQGTKTMRQLKEEEMQSAILDLHNPIDFLLEEVKRERKVIDEKVKRFVNSLDEKKRSERLKQLMSETTLINTRSSLQIN